MAEPASLTTLKRLIPPAPEPAPDTMGPLELARRMRTNGITPYTRRAYEEEVTQRRYFGRTMHVLNAPDAIRRVLVDNHEGYGRTRASLRILRPLVGAGLLVSEGADWRHQRRTLAPAFTQGRGPARPSHARPNRGRDSRPAGSARRASYT